MQPLALVEPMARVDEAARKQPWTDRLVTVCPTMRLGISAPHAETQKSCGKPTIDEALTKGCPQNSGCSVQAPAQSLTLTTRCRGLELDIEWLVRHASIPCL